MKKLFSIALFFTLLSCRDQISVEKNFDGALIVYKTGDMIFFDKKDITKSGSIYFVNKNEYENINNSAYHGDISCGVSIFEMSFSGKIEYNKGEIYQYIVLKSKRYKRLDEYEIRKFNLNKIPGAHQKNYFCLS